VKRGRTVLVATVIIVGFVYQTLANAAPAYLPTFTPRVFWGAVITIILITVIVSILQSRAESKQAANKPRTPPLPQRNDLRNKSPTLRGSNQTSAKPTEGIQNSSPLSAIHLSPNEVVEEGQPTVEHPALFCLAIDVSDSMIEAIIDHTGKTIQRWTSIQIALDRFVYLGAGFVKDPQTRKVLPLYNLMAYGFGFAERAYPFRISKKPGGAVRDLLSHPSLPALPSAGQLSDHWSEYKDRLASKEYTLDLFGDTPMCQALTLIRDRIKEELAHKEFTFPVLLLVVSDGEATDGDPLPIISEFHAMGVMTLCCYLGDKNVLNAKRLYEVEDPQWTEGAKSMFRMASVLHADSYLSRAMFDYLTDTGWQPHEGVRLFAQINHTEALDSFLKVLLSGFIRERQGQNHAASSETSNNN